MRWSIRNQILAAFSLLLLLAVAGTASIAALLAAQRGDAERIRQLQTLVETLGDARFPYTESVLQQMRGLSGGDFVATGADGQIAASTLPVDVAPESLPTTAPVAASITEVGEFPVATLAGRNYYAARVRGSGAAGVHWLYILYPVQNWQEARWEAMWPPLAVGCVAFLLAFAVSAWLAHRSAARIQLVQQLFSKLVARQFPAVPVRPPYDEIYELQVSANQLSTQLAGMEREIRRTERLRLLGQLAGGIAHQLRNAATGARMALELHRRRCLPRTHDQSLDVAMRQLSLMETQIKGLLSLGHPAERAKRPGHLRAILEEVEELLQPVCKHGKVELEVRYADGETDARVDDADEIQAALLNLALNGVEAAGPGGRVDLDVHCAGGQIRIRITDTGSGPPEELQESLFDPFTTSKPEGVGLGLALARQAAIRRGGSLTWSREAGCTVFLMSWPADPSAAEVDGPVLTADPVPAALNSIARGS